MFTGWMGEYFSKLSQNLNSVKISIFSLLAKINDDQRYLMIRMNFSFEYKKKNKQLPTQNI